ncbi:MAG: metal ABC transporter solute-binding protein, Zn/Mn family [Mariniblastus sp.]
MTIKHIYILTALLAATFAVGCNFILTSEITPATLDATATNNRTKLQLVATTGQINAALVKLTRGTDASIKLFCGPGVDPHSFSASTQDVQALLDADLVIYNGFHLEAKLSEHLHGSFKDKSWSMASAFPKSARLDWVEDGQIDSDAPFDPHIWNHLPGWSECVNSLAVRLGQSDPANANLYLKNADAYIAEIMEAHLWAEKKLSALPQQNRTIVSAHDAFNYFAKVYNMQTLAVLGVGNDPEADIRTMRSVAETICEKRVPAIFMESITNPKVTQALQEACSARDWNVKLVSQPLYSDDIGESAPQNTFLGAFKSNVEIIFESLKN